MSYNASAGRRHNNNNTSNISRWIQYAMIGIFGYLLGTIQQSPMQVIQLASTTLYNARTLGEEQKDTVEEKTKVSGFDLTSDEDVTVVTCIVLLLIFLTIAFEFIKEHLEEGATRNLRPLVDKLFGEMTVLGFLSIVTFAITKAGWFTALSDAFFGEDNELLEIFEFVHFTIFFIMIFFVVQVLVLVAAATDTEKQWIEMDKTARDPSLLEEWERRAESYYDDSKAKRRRSFQKAREVTGLLPFIRDQKAQTKEDQILFKALRDEFVLERSPHYPFHPAPEEKRVSSDFNFGRYLGMNQGSMLTQVVEVSIITWTFYALLTIIYYVYVILVNENVTTLAWSWVAMGWLVYAFNLFFERHLIEVRKMFLTKEMFLKARVDNKDDITTLLDADETTYLNSLCDGKDPNNNLSMPLWTEIDIDEYHAKRSWLVKYLVGGQASRQHSIYWMDRRGPKLYLLILQSNLLFLGIYAAMNFLGFFQFMYKEHSLVVFIAYMILASLPLLTIMLTKQHTVAVLSQVCCMGAYRRPNVVASVLREEKTARVVRAFIVIYKMRRFAMKAETTEYDPDQARLFRLNFDPVELREVGKTFDAFDTNLDGSVSQDEFENLMKNLGAEVSPEGLRRMVAMLDADGDGVVSKEEFINWYAENAHDDDLSEEERAHFLFRMFDRENAGELTIAEFKRKLDALNVGFSVDEVGAIVNELDEDNSGTIGLYEFEDLLNKYYPKELRAAIPPDKKAHNSGGMSWLFGEHRHTTRPGNHRGGFLLSDWNNSGHVLALNHSDE